ncbi:MAG: hypothetical protein QNJ72_15500 [Pleurocapsa sp. MO_226.B13]|nr:hypothetical protein [Pleurocapsa sp. MO_226.B13]
MSLFPITDVSEFFSSLTDEVKEDILSKIPKKKELALSHLGKLLPTAFDLDYIKYAILPSLVTSVYQGERLSLPMLDEEKFSKENALPYYLWGLLYDNWEPNQEEDGLSVFIQGYEKRGNHNRRKRIYYSAVTPDLYRLMYGDKVVKFFDQLFDQKNAGKPLMRQYLDSYFDLYWDLHLGVKGDAIPPEVREIGESFNTVLAYLDPTKEIVYDNYMRVRALRKLLKDWIEERVNEVKNKKVEAPEKTFVYYWLLNGEEGEDFRRKDIVFECFHNFVAFSQWGNTIYNIMKILSKDTGDPDVRAWLKKTMEGDYDRPLAPSPFTPLEQFVMELFRTISPNAGSVSTIEETRKPLYERYGYIFSPHKATSEEPRHWENPKESTPSATKMHRPATKLTKPELKKSGLPNVPSTNRPSQ